MVEIIKIEINNKTNNINNKVRMTTKYENNYENKIDEIDKIDKIEKRVDNIPLESLIHLQDCAAKYLENKHKIEEAQNVYEKYHKGQEYSNDYDKYCDKNIESASNDKIVYKLISHGYGYHSVEAYDSNNNNKLIGIVDSFHD